MLRGLCLVATEEGADGQFVMLRDRIVATLVGGVLWVGIVVAVLVAVRWCMTLAL
jgi:hypothetical protein